MPHLWEEVSHVNFDAGTAYIIDHIGPTFTRLMVFEEYHEAETTHKQYDHSTL